MKKQIVRLTESDLHNIIKNSVNKVLKEICEIDDMRDQCMSSDWDLHDAENLKYSQMQNDWEGSDFDDLQDYKYFDQLYDDNYLKDYNGNVHDFHKEREYPF